MASRPKRAALVAKLAELAIEEVGEGATALDYITAQLSSGMLISEIAEFLTTEMKQPTTRAFLSLVAHGLSPDAKERIAAARKDGALELGERAVELADTAEPTSGASSRARNSMSGRQWLAERFNPALAAKGATVQIDAANLMLQALMQPPPLRPVALPAETDTAPIKATARITGSTVDERAVAATKTTVVEP